MSRTFPFWHTVGQSIALTFQHAGLLLRVSWAWLLVTAPFLFGFEYLVTTLVPETDHTATATAYVFVYSMLQSVVLMPMLSSIAVAWHRKLLRNEEPPRGAYLRCDRVVFNYAVVGLAISCALYVMIVGVMGLAAMPFVIPAFFGNLALGVSAVVVVFCATMYVSTRLFTILPHFALGLPRNQVMDGWRASYGQFWNLFLGGCLVMILAMLIAMVVAAVVALMPWPTEMPALDVAATSLQALAFAVIFALPGVTFLSLTYQALVDGADGANRPTTEVPMANVSPS